MSIGDPGTSSVAEDGTGSMTSGCGCCDTGSGAEEGGHRESTATWSPASTVTGVVEEAGATGGGKRQEPSTHVLLTSFSPEVTVLVEQARRHKAGRG